MTKSLSIPSIHLNGTSGDALCEEIREAHFAIAEAIAKLSQMTVHGRDHYIKADPESFTKARDEHVRRLDMLRQVNEELMEIYQGIRDQM